MVRPPVVSIATPMDSIPSAEICGIVMRGESVMSDEDRIREDWLKFLDLKADHFSDLDIFK